MRSCGEKIPSNHHDEGSRKQRSVGLPSHGTQPGDEVCAREALARGHRREGHAGGRTQRGRPGLGRADGGRGGPDRGGRPLPLRQHARVVGVVFVRGSYETTTKIRLLFILIMCVCNVCMLAVVYEFTMSFILPLCASGDCSFYGQRGLGTAIPVARAAPPVRACT